MDINNPQNRITHNPQVQKDSAKKQSGHEGAAREEVPAGAPRLDQMSPDEVFNYLSQQGRLSTLGVEHPNIAKSIDDFITTYPPEQYDQMVANVLEQLKNEPGMPKSQDTLEAIANEVVANMVLPQVEIAPA